MKNLSILLSAAILLLLAVSPVAAELCPKCKGKMYIQSIGKCVECGGTASSGAFKLCKKCSAKLGQCEHCRAPLGGTDQPAEKSAQPIQVGETDSGKTFQPQIAQEVVISLPGNPTTGYSWFYGKMTDLDAAVSLGEIRYVRDPAGAGRMGAGGTFVATFKSLKAGKTVLNLEYKRPWEKDTPPIKTFSITIEVKGGAGSEQAEKLKAAADKFILRVTYHGQANKQYQSLMLHNPNIRFKLVEGWWSAPVDRAQVEKIVDHLAADGFFDRAVLAKLAGKPADPGYTLSVSASGPSDALAEELGWEGKMLGRLDSLRKVLDGRAAEAMDHVLKPLEPYREKWKSSEPKDK